MRQRRPHWPWTVATRAHLLQEAVGCCMAQLARQARQRGSTARLGCCSCQRLRTPAAQALPCPARAAGQTVGCCASTHPLRGHGRWQHCTHHASKVPLSRGQDCAGFGCLQLLGGFLRCATPSTQLAEHLQTVQVNVRWAAAGDEGGCLAADRLVDQCCHAEAALWSGDVCTRLLVQRQPQQQPVRLGRRSVAAQQVPQLPLQLPCHLQGLRRLRHEPAGDHPALGPEYQPLLRGRCTWRCKSARDTSEPGGPLHLHAPVAQLRAVLRRSQAWRQAGPAAAGAGIASASGWATATTAPQAAHQPGRAAASGWGSGSFRRLAYRSWGWLSSTSTQGLCPTKASAAAGCPAAAACTPACIM